MMRAHEAALKTARANGLEVGPGAVNCGLADGPGLRTDRTTTQRPPMTKKVPPSFVERHTPVPDPDQNEDY